MRRMSPGAWVLFLTVLVSAYVLLGLRLQTHWWFEDDPYQFAYAARQARPWAFFLSREGLSKGLIGLQFTPVQNLTYWIDGQIAPRSVGFAYFHTALSLWLSALMFFLVLKHWVEVRVAVAVVGLMLLLPATIAIVEFISLRNYLDGLFLSLMGMWLAQRAAAAHGLRHAALATVALLFALLGSLAKELYVTTPFALVALMFAGRRRWAGVAIFAAGGLAYVAYYRAIIGSLTSTSTVPTLSLAEYPRFLWRYPYVFAGSPAGWLLAAVMAAGLAYGVWRRLIRWRDLALAGGLVVVALASMHPAAGALDREYASRGTWYRVSFVSSLVMLATGAWLVAKLPRAWRLAVGTCALLTLAAGAWLTVRTWDDLKARYRAEGLFYLNNPGKLLYSEVPAWWFLVGVDDLYHVPARHYLLAARPNQPGDAEMLSKFQTVWRYAPASGVFAPEPDLYRQLTDSR